MSQLQSQTWHHAIAAQNLAELFQSRTDPSHVFAACDDGRVFTYGQFWTLAGRFASALKNTGAKPGDRIAVQVDKSIEALTLFWACVRGGFVFLPLNTAYTRWEVTYFLEDSGAKLFICTPARETEMGGLAQLLTLDDGGGGSLMAVDHPWTEDIQSDWDDLAAILYTSGTTGRSKGAMLTHGNLASNALALIDIWQFTPRDVLLHALPVHHTHGLFVGMNTIALSGGQLIFHRKFNADAVMKDLPRATCMMGVPTFYTRLLQHADVTRETTRHIRVFISGSAPLLAETHRAFEDKTGHAILERYGMTETNMIASNPFDGARRAGTVGFPLPHVSVRITDPATGASLPDGTDGMIEVKGPNLFQAYWNKPDKTAEDIRADGFFITGDLGRIDAEGYLIISGRAKDLIITGGFNVYPKEIEEVLDTLLGVTESAVIGLPHDDFGEAVTAVVATSQTLDEAKLIAALKTQLGAFKVPKRVLFVAELPRNAMGKVQKAELRRIHASLYRPV